MVVLRSDRRISPATAEPGTVGVTAGFTVGDVGRQLSRQRNRQGLSLQDVALRTGIPVDQLRAAETGAIDRPDGLATLKTVRRYADFLGLPGDRFALAILERWPTKGGPHPFAARAARAAQAAQAEWTQTALQEAAPRPQLTGPTASLPSLGSLELPGPPGDGTARNHTENGQGSGKNGRVRANGEVEPAPASAFSPVQRVTSRPDDTSYWNAFSDTGVTPAVLAPEDQVWRRPRRGVPVALQAVVVLVTLAVLAGLALLAVDRLKPSWLRAVGLTHAATPSTAPAASRGSRQPATHGTATAAIRPTKTAGAAAFVVRASSFTTKVTSPGGPCWVEVFTNTSSAPAYTGVIAAGGSQTFSHVHSLVVEMGSTAGRLSVSSSGGHVSTFAPSGVPYRITIRTHS